MFLPRGLSFPLGAATHVFVIMSYRDRLKRIYKQRILRGPFSEPVTVAPATDLTDSRDITASITPERNANHADHSERTTDRIEVFCLRDQSDPDVGGIDELTSGYRLTRTAAHDPDHATPFAFSGEVLEQGEHYWRAIFERFQTPVQGIGIS